MNLSKRPPVHTLPTYSLTGDLLGFLRCGLQYRYTRIGGLPSSNPVQMWFGQFIHGVLEEGYRRYEANKSLPPWPESDVADIIKIIKKRLAAQNLFPWTKALEDLGDARAFSALNDLAPQLFPLIHRAEVRLRGARKLPLDQIPEKYRLRSLDQYEMVGIVDVISHVSLSDPIFQDNSIVKEILRTIGEDHPDEFEVILDYKGMRRHALNTLPTKESPWEAYAWQIQTYAHLRSTHEDSLPVIAGVIVYVNELMHTWDDLEELRKETNAGLTDVAPQPASEDYKKLVQVKSRSAASGDSYPDQMSLDFRLNRALRVIPVTEKTITEALCNFDKVVTRIEICQGKEQEEGRVLTTWETNATEENEDTCKACDSRTFCLAYKKEPRPRLPGTRVKG